MIYNTPSIYQNGFDTNILKGKAIDYDIVLNPYWETKQTIIKSILKEYKDFFIWSGFQIQGHAVTSYDATPSDPWYFIGNVVLCYFDFNETILFDTTRTLFFDSYSGNMDFISAVIRYRNINGVDRLCLNIPDGSKMKRNDAYFNCCNIIANKP